MIITHNTDKDFKTEAKALIPMLESNSLALSVHADGLGIPTIGYGIALLTWSGEKDGYVAHAANFALLKTIGIELNPTQRDVLNRIAAAATIGKKCLATKGKEAEGRRAIAEATRITLQNLTPSIRQITDDEATTLFNGALDRAMASIEKRFEKIIFSITGVENEGTNLYNSLKNSKEMLVIASLGYNSPNLVGESLITAIWKGNRAEAWFEIRYNSNSEAKKYLYDGASGPNMNGLAKRRFIESELFALYDNQNFADATESIRIYQMFQSHRRYISQYEQAYQSQIIEANKHNIIHVQTLAESLNPAKTALLADLRSFLPDIFKSDSEYLSTSIYLDPKAGDSPSVLKAVDYDSSGIEKISVNASILIGEGGNDVLVGGTNDDVLLGGDGNDILTGGKGSDVLVGGFGNDVYYFNESDGLDSNNKIIEEREADGRKHGTIVLRRNDGIELVAAGFFQKDEGVENSYHCDITEGIRISLYSESGNWYFIAPGSTGNSRINLGTDFKSGDFGIILGMDEPTTSETITINEPNKDNYASNPLVDGLSDTSRKVEASLGSDMVFGSKKVDILNGGDGNDWIVGAGGADLIKGGDGNDFINWISGGTQVEAGDGDDIVVGSLREWFHIYKPKAEISADVFWSDWKQHFFSAGHGQAPYVGSDGYITIGLWSSFVKAGDIFTGNSSKGDGWKYEFGVPQAGGDVVIKYWQGENSTSFILPAVYTEHGVEPAPSDTVGLTLLGEKGSDLLAGNDGADNIAGGSEKDFLFGNKGNDIIDGGEGDDLIAGGEGDDQIYGQAGLDEIYGESGSDVIFGGDGYDRIWADSLSVSLSSLDGNDYVYGGKGNDQIIGGGKDDCLFGGDDDDYIQGDDGNDYLDGGAGNDNLVGGIGNDTLVGGPGTDYMQGGANDDTYVLNPGEGPLSAGNAAEAIDDKEGNNTIIFGGSIYESLKNKVVRDTPNENDMIIQYGDSDYVYISGGFGANGANTAGAIKKFVFANGLTVSYEKFIGQNSPSKKDVETTAKYAHIVTGNQGDYIKATGGSSLISAGMGADSITVGGGGNRILYHSGDGADHITNLGASALGRSAEAPDTLWFEDGITPDDIKLEICCNTMALRIEDGTDDVIHFDSFDPNNVLSQRAIDVFEFEDGTTLTYAELVDRGFDIDGRSFGETMNGTDTKDRIYGNGGNDIISAGTGDDFLDGGLDNDILSGGAGNDTYYFNKGYGNDSIVNSDSNPAAVDVLMLGYDISTSDVILRRSGNDLRLEINGTEDSVFVSDYFTTGAIDRIDFSDGTSWNADDINSRLVVELTAGNDTYTGTSGPNIVFGLAGDDIISGMEGDDRLDGGTGNDTLTGGAGNDTYYFGAGYGQDIIDNTDPSADAVDRISLGSGILADNLVLRKIGNNLIVQIKNSTDQITVNNYFATAPVDFIDFFDGTSWGSTDINSRGVVGLTDGNDNYIGTAGNDVIEGLGGDDTLYGEAGNDTIIGGLGNDTLDGGIGNDTYLFSRGDGFDTIMSNDTTPVKIDAIQFGTGITPDDIELIDRTSKSDNGLNIKIKGTSDQIKVINFFINDAATEGYRFEEIRFSDGTVWDVDQIKAKMLIGSDLPDTIIGYSSSDIINAGAERDSVYGGGGDDLINGGSMDDELYGEEGNDTIYGDTGCDRIYGGEGDDFIYDDGGYSYIYGGEGNDTIDCKGGLLDGGAGDDTYIYGRGYSNCSIFSNDTGANKHDIIKIDSSVSSSDIIIKRSSFITEKDDLTINIRGTLDYLTVKNFFLNDALSPGYRIEEISFSDGTSWNIDTIKAKLLIPTSASETISGYATSDILNGGGGSDAIFGMDGDDVIDGGCISDSIDGFDNDTLYGGNGNNIYLFGLGCGNDTINETNQADSISILRFKDGVSPLNVSLKASSGSLLVQLNDSNGNPTGDSVKITDYFSSNNNASTVDILEFADGTVWFFDDIAPKVTAATENNDKIEGTGISDTINGLGGSDLIYGAGGNDILMGGPGGDVLYGDDGDDVIAGGTGSDSIYGGRGNDNYIFNRGDGFDKIYTVSEDASKCNDIIKLGPDILPETVSFYRVNKNDLLIVIENSQDQLLISSYFEAERYQISQIEFDNGNGPSWTFADILQHVIEGTQNNMIGTSGNDIFEVDHEMDKITESSNAGVDTVNSSRNYILPSNVENINLTGYLNINATGNEMDNILKGNANDNVINGMSGYDIGYGGKGNDTYINIEEIHELQNEGIDTIREWSVTYENGNGTPFTLPENVEELYMSDKSNIYSDLNIIGNGLDNTLVGGWSNGLVILDGGAGADIMISGRAMTYFVIDNPGDKVFGHGGIRSYIDYTLAYGYSSLSLIGTASISGTGNDQNNLLFGNKNPSPNTLKGGKGDDQYTLGLGDIAIENPEEGYDVVIEARDFSNDGLIWDISPFLNIEEFRLDISGGGYGGIKGDARNNVLIGNYSSNHLDGGSGADIMIGGEGFDTYVVDNIEDIIIENSYGAVKTYLDNYLCPANIQHLYLLGEANLNAQCNGNSLGTIKGNAGANVIQGAINKSCSLYGNDGNDTLIGGEMGDHLQGDGGNDILNGGAGRDNYSFDSGFGQDIINIGIFSPEIQNSDRISISAPSLDSSWITLARSGDTDILLKITGTNDQILIKDAIQNSECVLDVIQIHNSSWNNDAIMERLNYINGSTGDDNLSGDSTSNRIFGFSGNDNLYGGADNDSLYGGAGNDTLVGGEGIDTYFFESGFGQDIINSTGNIPTDKDSIVFGSGFYAGGIRFIKSANDLQIKIEGTTDMITAKNHFLNNATTSEAINEIRFSDGTVFDISSITLQTTATYGTSANNTLNGTTAQNVIKGFGGTDTIKANSGADIIYGGDGGDKLYGDAGDDKLFGDAGNDTLYGGSDNDILNGGLGSDSLRGDAGNDTYLFGADFFTTGDGLDTIYDTGGADTLMFDANISKDSVAIFKTKTGSDVLFDFGRSVDIGTPGDEVSQVKITKQTIPTYAVEKFVTSDGYWLSSSDVNKILQDMTAYASENGFTISNFDDVRSSDQLMQIINTAWHAPA